MEGMSTPTARDRGLQRVVDLTTWAGVGALALTGGFALAAAHSAHTSPSSSAGSSSSTAASSSSTSSSSSSSSAGGLATGQAPSASLGSSHVRSGAS
jgi:hypothetical protein